MKRTGVSTALPATPTVVPMTVITGGRAHDRDVVPLCQRWAEWRLTRNSDGLGWPRRTVLGRVLDGMPSTKCIACQGSGRVAGHRIGAVVAFVHCALCEGAGRVKADNDPACCNPAFIRSTAPFASDREEVISERVDALVAGLGGADETRSLYFVLFFEYTRSGTQRMKAQKLGISDRWYRDLLGRAHDHVRRGLTSSVGRPHIA